MDYDDWLTSFLEYEDDDDDLTEEERQKLKDLYDEWHGADQYEKNERNKLDY